MSKRVLDLIAALTGLMFLTPVIVICATLILLTSRGPVLFTQWRLGRHGRPFRILKFRTMYRNVPEVRNADGSTYVGLNDPRVTSIGRILRTTSLDELPQLWNVVRGDMSLVGPRPDQVDQRSSYTPHEAQKLNVKPGLTGLAQISGRNQICWEKRKALDVEYVHRQSFTLDLQILIKTIPYVCLRKGVYSRSASDSAQSRA